MIPIMKPVYEGTSHSQAPIIDRIAENGPSSSTRYVLFSSIYHMIYILNLLNWLEPPRGHSCLADFEILHSAGI